MGKCRDAVILTAVCWTRLFIIGLKFTSGIFYVALLLEFHQTSGVTSWITTVQYFSTSVTCALGGMLVKRYGCRVTTMTGGCLMVFGMLCSGFAENFIHVFITFGIISGFGGGLVYIGSYEAAKVSFSSHRNLAFGFGGFVSGLGVIVYPPLLQWLIDSYTWRGMFWIISALYLNIVVVAVLFPGRDVKVLSPASTDPRDKSATGCSPESILNDNRTDNIGESDARQQQGRTMEPKEESFESDVISPSDIHQQNNQLPNTPQLHNKWMNYQFDHDTKARSLKLYRTMKTVGQIERTGTVDFGVVSRNYDCTSDCHKNKVEIADDIPKHSFVFIIPIRDDITQEIKNRSFRNKYVINLSSPSVKWYQKISFPWRGSLRNAKGFYLFILSGTMSLFGGSIITGHLSAHALSAYGTDPLTASMTYTAFGVSAAFGKLLQGALVNRNRFNPVLVYVVCGIFGGVGTLVFVFDLSILMLYAYVVAFSLCYASRGGAILPAIIIRLAGEDNFALGLGLYTLITSLGYLLGAPLAGCLFDYTQSYMWSFVMAAIAVMSSSLIMLISCGRRDIDDSS